jgi:hypothetical protein
LEIYGDTATVYRDFAREAAYGSPCFREWASAVAEDAEVLAWLQTLPEHKRQANLVFAAARWCGVPAPGPYAGLRDALLADEGPIRATIMSRATQTNEVGRLATLLPAFASLGDGPLALLEVGASAGLCLYPDRFSYHWSNADGSAYDVGAGPLLTCAVTGSPPLPDALPEVMWRAGLDLSPIDVRDDDAVRWLENLVWPEQEARRERLRAAVAVARADPPRLEQGDLLVALPDLLDEVPGEPTVVVFHSAVIAYLEHDDRERFAASMRALVEAGRCHWVSNEGPRVLPGLVPPGVHIPFGRFVLAVDGRPVALSHGHGAELHWL